MARGCCFEIHLFESRVSPDGARGVAAWAAYWKELHAGFADAASAWDAFMPNSVTFYAPDLTPFVRKMRARGVPVASALYGDDDTPVYSASVVLPGTGSIVEIVSEHVDSTEVKPFVAWSADACADANKLTQTFYRDGQAMLLKGSELKNQSKFEKKEEWDGGSTGRVKTKGKRGPGWA